VGAQCLRHRCKVLGLASLRAQQPGSGLHDLVVPARSLKNPPLKAWSEDLVGNATSNDINAASTQGPGKSKIVSL
jgi:hypothetical protein